MRPAGIVCYWEYRAPQEKHRDVKLWVLKETYGVDMDGYPLTDEWMGERTGSRTGCDGMDF